MTIPAISQSGSAAVQDVNLDARALNPDHFEAGDKGTALARCSWDSGPPRRLRVSTVIGMVISTTRAPQRAFQALFDTAGLAT